jgi:hypothetical protein
MVTPYFNFTWVRDPRKLIQCVPAKQSKEKCGRLKGISYRKWNSERQKDVPIEREEKRNT